MVAGLVVGSAANAGKYALLLTSCHVLPASVLRIIAGRTCTEQQNPEL
jgi:hypothetical protein